MFSLMLNGIFFSCVVSAAANRLCHSRLAWADVAKIRKNTYFSNGSGSGRLLAAAAPPLFNECRPFYLAGLWRRLSFLKP
jgi:hypothetical protein